MRQKLKDRISAQVLHTFSSAETDMNVVMSENGSFIEVQGTAEGAPFSRSELDQMLNIAETGITELIRMQKSAVANK